jgi:hypothetical protein
MNNNLKTNKMKKKETLEEAALLANPIHLIWDEEERYDCNQELRETFIDGAKWQQEQDKKMYSEEEIRKALLDIVLVNPAHISLLKSGYGQFPDTFELTEKGVDYVLEQFKNK